MDGQNPPSQDPTEGLQAKYVENKATAKSLMEQVHGENSDDHDPLVHKKGDSNPISRAVAEKLWDGDGGVVDLYRSYKNSPHYPSSMFLKYAVHRLNNIPHYNDPQKAQKLDKDFMSLHSTGGAADKNGHVKVDTLKEWLKINPHVPERLLNHQTNLHHLIDRGVGLNKKKIGGETYVALARGLGSTKMTKEHSLSSFSDDRNESSNYGNVFDTWVPLRDLWYSYDLGPKGASSDEHGPENEFLVSNTGVRYHATPKDIKKIRYKHHSGGFHFPKTNEFNPYGDRAAFDDATDGELAAKINASPFWHQAEKYATHPNAGQESLAAALKFEGGKHLLLAHRSQPAEHAMAHWAGGSQWNKHHYILDNPNLEKHHIHQILDTIPPQLIPENIANHPNLDSSHVSKVVDKITDAQKEEGAGHNALPILSILKNTKDNPHLLSKESFKKIADNINNFDPKLYWSVLANVADHPALDRETADKLHLDQQNKGSKAFLASGKVSPHILGKELKAGRGGSPIREGISKAEYSGEGWNELSGYIDPTSSSFYSVLEGLSKRQSPVPNSFIDRIIDNIKTSSQAAALDGSYWKLLGSSVQNEKQLRDVVNLSHSADTDMTLKIAQGLVDNHMAVPAWFRHVTEKGYDSVDGHQFQEMINDEAYNRVSPPNHAWNAVRQASKMIDKFKEGKGIPKPLPQNMQKSEKRRMYWVAPDGGKIPHQKNPDREHWDNNYFQELVRVFANGDPSLLRPVTVDMDRAVTRNLPVDKGIFKFYQHMLAGGDKMPPIVVLKCPSSGRWDVVDGNHRSYAASELGVSELPGFEILPTQKEIQERKDKKPLKWVLEK